MIQCRILWRGLDFVSVWLLHEDSTNLISVLWDEVHLGETFVLKMYRGVVSCVVWSQIYTYEVYIRVRHCTHELIIVRFHCSLFIPGSLGTWERIWTVRLFLGRSGVYSFLGTGLWTWGVGCWSTEREGGLVQQRGLDAVARFWIEELCPSVHLLDTRFWLAAAADCLVVEVFSSTPKWSLLK